MLAPRLFALLANGRERVSVVSISRDPGIVPLTVRFCGADFRRTTERTRGGLVVYQQQHEARRVDP